MPDFCACRQCNSAEMHQIGANFDSLIQLILIESIYLFVCFELLDLIHAL